MMALREARREDAAALAALSLEVWIGTYLRRGIGRVFADYALDTFTRAHFEQLLADQTAPITVSDNLDGIDGFVRWVPNRPAPVTAPISGEAEIATLYVQPRHHGKGIGTALLHRALAQAHRTDASAVWLTTNSENSPALAFYKRMGFAQIGYTDFHIQDGAYRNDVLRYCFAGRTSQQS